MQMQRGEVVWPVLLLVVLLWTVWQERWCCAREETVEGLTRKPVCATRMRADSVIGCICASQAVLPIVDFT